MVSKLPVALLLALAGCGDGGGREADLAPADVPRARFDEVGVQAGLDLQLTCGAPGDKRTIHEVNGNGAVLADLDGDGDLDLLLVDGNTRDGWAAGRPVTHHLFRNDGPAGGVPRFVRQLHDTGLVMSGWPTGAVAGDVDGDGRTDLLVGGLGEDALFLNRSAEGGELRFARQVLPGRTSPLDWTSSLGLADADGDGRLDLYLARYLTLDPAAPPPRSAGPLPCSFKGHAVLCGPHGLPAQPDVYLRGIAPRDGGAPFEEAGAAAGLAALAPAYALGVLFMDLDLDGHADLYVANDSVDNVLLRNRGDGTFEDRSALSGTAADAAGRPQAGMGVDAGDVDGDGDLDLVVTNFSDEPNALYRHEGPLLYREVSLAAGLAHRSRALLGWGVHLADLDADGALDLVYANGHVYPQADLPGTGTAYRQPVALQLGAGDGTFGDDVFPDRTPLRGRALLRGDVDGDGDLDLLVLELDGRPRLYVNRTDAPERQLLVELRAEPDPDGRLPPGGRDAFGATLFLDGARGPVVRQKIAGNAFQSGSDPRLHVGAPAGVTAARVLWPGGESEALEPAAFVGGRVVTVVRGRGVTEVRPLDALP